MPRRTKTFNLSDEAISELQGRAKRTGRAMGHILEDLILGAKDA